MFQLKVAVVVVVVALAVAVVTVVTVITVVAKFFKCNSGLLIKWSIWTTSNYDILNKETHPHTARHTQVASKQLKSIADIKRESNESLTNGKTNFNSSVSPLVYLVNPLEHIHTQIAAERQVNTHTRI